MRKLRQIFSAKPTRRHAAGGWWREDEDFVKFKDMGDGEVTSLLIGEVSKSELDKIYEEAKQIIEKRQAAFQLYALSFAFATIAFFGLSSEIEISGVSLDTQILPHVAMTLMCYSSWSFSNINSKLGYFTTLFEHLYFSKDNNDRAKFLLEYPQVIQPFLFSRATRGFPKYIFPKRWPWWERASQFGLLFGIIIGAIIALMISFYGFWIIWNSNFPSPFLAKSFVVLMVTSGFFVWANPAFTGLPRRYRHSGLSESIQKLPESRRREYHRLIDLIRLKREALASDSAE